MAIRHKVAPHLSKIDFFAFLLLYVALLMIFDFTLLDGLILAFLLMLFIGLLWAGSTELKEDISKYKKAYAILLIFLMLFMGLIDPFVPNWLNDGPPDYEYNDDVYVTPGNPQFETNFELILHTLAGNRIMESYAFHVKQYLAPLGIHVTVLAAPAQQFFRQQQQSQRYDISIIQLPTPPNVVPELGWKYHSDANLTLRNYELFDLDPDFDSWITQDVGIDLATIDELLEQIEVQMDNQERLGLINQFLEVYMDKILYELPLITLDPYISVIRGYGDDNNSSTCVAGNLSDESDCDNDLFDADEGLLESRALGAKWHPETTPYFRQDQADLTTLQLRTLSLPHQNFYNPYLVWDPVSRNLLEPLVEGIFNIDKDMNLHPGIAYNYLEEDWVRLEEGTNTKGGKITLFLNAEQRWQFPLTQGYDGTIYSPHPVDAQDLSLALTLMKNYSTSLSLLDQFNYRYLDHWTINSTVFANDTITLYYSYRNPNDLYNLAHLVPIPDHILGHQLHLDNGTSYSFGSDLDPLVSEEWQFFSTHEGSSLVGPYSVSSFGSQQYYEYSAREDYAYPNEWDTEEIYSQYTSNFSVYGSLYNFSYFAPHINYEPTDAYYWGYADNPSTPEIEEPSSQNIESLIYRVVDDDNAAAIMFEAGQLDHFRTNLLGESLFEEHLDNIGIIVRETLLTEEPISLVFNLQNDYLKQRDIRYAIASVLNREDMLGLNGGLSSIASSPIPSYFNQLRPIEFFGEDGISDTNDDLYWSTDQYAIPYSYETGRDLMRASGYWAYDTAHPLATYRYEHVFMVFPRQEPN